MSETSRTNTESHTLRRIKFGTSVAVAVIAAFGLTILVNWIAARQYVRVDLTQSGSYSLSAQTKTVLDKLDGKYELFTLLPDQGSVADSDLAVVYRNVQDMVNEYGRYSGHVTTDKIDLRRDVVKAEQLNKAIIDAFHDELQPVMDAIDKGRASLKDVMPINEKLTDELTAGVNNDPNTTETNAQKLFRAAATRCAQFTQTAEQAEKQVDEGLDQVLVNYSGVKQQFQAALVNYDKMLGVFIQSAGALNRVAGLDNADKERLLESVDLAKQARAALADPIKQLDEAKDAPHYNRVLYGLTGGASVVVLGPKRVKVLPVSDMWRQDMRGQDDTGHAQPQYLIEEKLTGALLSMTIKQPPMVVFLLSGTGAALGPRGLYNNVAERLENADFKVTQWNPAGQVSAMGQPTPPTPRPEAEPGQKTVWIVLPTSGQTGNPLLMAANPRKQIADLLKERLDAGDAAMVMLAADPNATFGLANPITEFLKTWGINAQTDRLILQSVPQANRRSVTSLQFPVDVWPTALPITTALNGLTGMFIQPSPIVTDDKHEATHQPLVKITGDKLWTTTDLSSPEAVQNAKYDPDNSADAYTIAIASERGGKRMVTFAEQVWASDYITGMGLLGPNTASITGSAYPANSELFVNSVMWLAGLEDLIAASPRTQDVPRIQPMSVRAYGTYKVVLLAGLPSASLVLGLGVWWRRRSA